MMIKNIKQLLGAEKAFFVGVLKDIMFICSIGYFVRVDYLRNKQMVLIIDHMKGLNEQIQLLSAQLAERDRQIEALEAQLADLVHKTAVSDKVLLLQNLNEQLTARNEALEFYATCGGVVAVSLASLGFLFYFFPSTLLAVKSFIPTPLYGLLQDQTCFRESKAFTINDTINGLDWLVTITNGQNANIFVKPSVGLDGYISALEYVWGLKTYSAQPGLDFSQNAILDAGVKVLINAHHTADIVSLSSISGIS